MMQDIIQLSIRKSCNLSQSTPVHFFWFVGYLPPRLPTSCLTMAPRFDTLARSEALSRRPLLEINRAGEIHQTSQIFSCLDLHTAWKIELSPLRLNMTFMSSFQDGNSRPQTAPTDIKKDDKYPTESEETDEGRRKGSKSPRNLLWVFYPQEHKQRIY